MHVKHFKNHKKGFNYKHFPQIKNEKWNIFCDNHEV